MAELTEKIRMFLDDYATDLNPVRAAKRVGLTQREYDAVLNDPAYRPYLKEANDKFAATQSPAADKAPPPTPVSLDARDVKRESINHELISVMNDLKNEAISPGQATAAVNVLKALAAVNGLITQDVTITNKKPLEEMSNEELHAILQGRDNKFIDVTPEGKVNSE